MTRRGMHYFNTLHIDSQEFLINQFKVGFLVLVDSTMKERLLHYFYTFPYWALVGYTLQDGQVDQITRSDYPGIDVYSGFLQAFHLASLE